MEFEESPSVTDDATVPTFPEAKLYADIVIGPAATPAFAETALVINFTESGGDPDDIAADHGPFATVSYHGFGVFTAQRKFTASS
jgi:hypothetical protein